MRTPDGYIIMKCLNGDSAAFGLLVDKYKESVYALAYSKLLNLHDAEDVTQEVFIKAYKKLRTLRQYDSFHAWLYAITSNLCKDWLKARTKRLDTEFIEDKNPETLEILSIEAYKDRSKREELYESVRQALNSLPDKYRQILTLYYLGGMDGKEIATFLGIAPMAVWRRLSRARSQFKEEILNVMNTVFKEKRLPMGFTMNIVEAVKRMSIPLMPRLSTLTLGLSLSVGIIATILGTNLSLSTSDLSNTFIKPVTPAEMSVLRDGEIPFNVFKVSTIPLLSDSQSNKNFDVPKPQFVLAMDIQGKSEIGSDLPQTDNSKTNLIIKEIPIDKENPVEANSIDQVSIQDKEKLKEYDWIMPGTPVYSPDEKRVAFVAMRNNKMFAVIDGIEGKDYYDIGTPPIFSPDSKRVAYAAVKYNKWVVVADGFEGKEYDEIKLTPIFSPDNKQILYIAKQGEKTFIVLDGVEYKGYDAVFSPIFSPDSKRLAYSAYLDGKVFAVVDGIEQKQGDSITPLIFSPNSKRLICLVERDDKAVISLDGVEMRERYDKVFNVTFSPDSKRFAYTAMRGDKWVVAFSEAQYTVKRDEKMITLAPKIIEGKEYDQLGILVFSPDGNRIAYKARSGSKWLNANDPLLKSDKVEMEGIVASTSDGNQRVMYGGKWLVVMDGVEGKEYDWVDNPVFSLDGKKMVYLANIRNKHYFVCDGKEVKEYENIKTPIGGISFDSPTKFHTTIFRDNEPYRLEVEIKEE